MFKDERVLEGLKTETYTATAILRYSPGGTKSGGFPCPNSQAVNIILLAHSRWGEAVSRVLKRSVVIAGHKTSISIEDEFWNSFKEIAGERGMALAGMIGEIDGDRKHANLSSAIRLFVLGFCHNQIATWGRH